jgi:hypothetical protein
MNDIDETYSQCVTQIPFYLPRQRLEQFDCQRCKALDTPTQQARVAFWTVAGEHDDRYVFMHLLCKPCAQLPIQYLHYQRLLDHYYRCLHSRSKRDIPRQSRTTDQRCGQPWPPRRYKPNGHVTFTLHQQLDTGKQRLNNKILRLNHITN